MFLQNMTRSKNMNTFFVEYDWQKGKYVHTWLRLKSETERNFKDPSNFPISSLAFKGRLSKQF